MGEGEGKHPQFDRHLLWRDIGWRHDDAALVAAGLSFARHPHVDVEILGTARGHCQLVQWQEQLGP